MRLKQSLFAGLSFLDLMVQVVTQPLTSDLFQIGDASTTGGCFGSKSITDLMLKDSLALLNAGQKAYDNYATDAGYRKLFSAWLGIQFDGVYVDDLSEFDWSAIGGRFQAVAGFLNGQGLPPPTRTSGEKPWLFCSDTFANWMSWNTGALDKDGKSMFVPNTNPQEIYMIHEVYATAATQQSWQPYWVPTLGGYDIDTYQATKICDKPGRFATTFSGKDVNPRGFPNTASYERHVILCPRSLDPAGSGFTVRNAPQLATSNYPLPGSALALDQFQTKGCSLYHEIFHVTDSYYTTGDPYYGMTMCNEAAINGDIAGKKAITTNPDSFMYFSLACWYYANAPSGMTPVLFLRAGLPVAS